MDTSNHFLLVAAYNNAVWCDTVCRSHSVKGEFHEAFWISQQQTPMYYPNLVTLSPTTPLTPHQDAVAEFLTMKKDYPISVKDSFAVLDLTPFGFHELFQAEWIFRQAPVDLSHQRRTDLQWKQLTSEKELLRWEEAWSQTASPLNHLFLPALLHDAGICIIAAIKKTRSLRARLPIGRRK